MLKDNLNIRFKKFKDSIINNKYKFGKYWEKEKITFEVDFKDKKNIPIFAYDPTTTNIFFLKKILINIVIPIKEALSWMWVTMHSNA